MCAADVSHYIVKAMDPMPIYLPIIRVLGISGGIRHRCDVRVEESLGLLA